MSAIFRLKRIAARALVALSLSALPTLAAAADILTNPGANQQWTVPPGVTSIDVEVWGAGGAGGGNNTTSDGGGGGGGGAYSKVTGIAVVPGSQLTYTIGLGGVGVAGGTGGTGGDSWFITTTTVLAKGGSGGAAPVAGAGGVGGNGGAAAAGVGTIKFSGGNGGAGRNNRTGQGGPGGSSAGTAANGTSGTIPWTTVTAAAAPAGGGIGGNGGAGRANGLAPASGNGGGGGGSGEAGRRGTVIGGNGTSGKIIISYVSAPLVTTDPATVISATGATLNGTVTSNGSSTTVTFDYGLTTAYGDIATAAQSPLAATAANAPVSATITGLSCNTTYHYRAVGSNASGTTNGNDATFTTGACVVTATPTACANVAGIGSVAWTIPGNPLTPAATASLNRTLPISNFLVCSGYNFNIPSTATIDGIVVGVSRYNAGRGTISDAAMRLVDATSTIGITDRSTATAYPTQTTVGTLENHGTATDLWGATWTPTDINSANFGAAFAAQYIGTRTNPHVAGVDGMPITIYYTPSANTAPDHLVIEHPTGTALTCAATTLTVRACADAACATPYTGGISGTLSASGTVNWDGTTGGATGAGFVIPSGSSSVTKNVQVTSASAAFGVATATPLPTNATSCNFNGTASCSLTTSTAGFIFSNTTTGNSYTIPVQVSGIATPTFYLRAVQASTTNPAVCTPAIIGQTVGVTMGYACNDPNTCQAGNLTTINATAVAPGGSPLNLSFDGNGSAPITARYDDAGQITLNASTTLTPFGGATPVTLSGSSNSFVVKPHHFVLSNIQQTAAPNLLNPAAADATGAKFVKAGEAFTVTVTSYNGLPTPTVTKNFGKEIAPESVKLAPNLVAGLGLINNPAISGTFSAFNNGVATGTGFSWPEVGIITLTPSIADGSYLGVGDVSGTASGNVGRFYAAQFGISANSINNRADICTTSAAAPGCPVTFTYLGERMDAVFTLTAQATTGTTTQNYVTSATPAQNFAKLDPTAAANPLGLTALDDNGTTRTPLNPLSFPAATTGSFASGAAAIVAPISVTRGGTTVGPYANAIVGIAPVDSDGATTTYDVDTVNAVAGANNHTTVGTTQLRYGKVTVSNGYGSELLPLTLAATVQYYDGTSWTTSSADDITSLSFATSYDIFNGATKAGTTSPTPTSGTVSGGILSITLSAPGAGVTGNTMIAPGAPAYLPPIPGQATFGVYKSNAPLIYMREN